MRRTIDLTWGPVSYLSWGSAGDPPVVLLHGGGIDDAALSWALLGPALAEAGHHVIAPDHPGHGQSPAAPWPNTQATLSAYVAELLAALGLGRCALGGLSLGGGLALQRALDHPATVDALVLLAPYGVAPRLYAGPLAGVGQVVAWAGVRAAPVALMDVALRSRRLVRASLAELVRDPARRTPELEDELAAAARRPRAWAPFAQFQRSEVRWNGLRTDLTDRLPTLTASTLLVSGTRDSAVPFAYARDAAGRIPGCRFVAVPGAGHWVQRDAPDVVAAAAVDHLAAAR